MDKNKEMEEKRLSFESKVDDMEKKIEAVCFTDYSSCDIMASVT